MCDYFDDEYGDQPDLTLGSLHETDSNYTGTPATDMVPTFPDSSSPERSDDATLNDSSNVLNDNFDAYSESANWVVSREDTSEQSDHSEYNMCKNYKNSVYQVLCLACPEPSSRLYLILDRYPV